MPIQIEEGPFANQEFTGNLDVRARTPISRRRFLELAGLNAVGLILAACAPPKVVEAGKISPPEATDVAKKETDEASKKIPDPTKVPDPTAQPEPTIPPEPTKETPPAIIKIESRSLKQDQELIDKVKSSRIASFLEIPKLETDPDPYKNYLNQVEYPDRIPVLSVTTISTSKGEQQLALIRHPETDGTQNIYLVTGRQSGGSLIQPSQASVSELQVVPLIKQGSQWLLTDPSGEVPPQEFAAQDGNKLSLSSPFGGVGEFDTNGPALLGLMDVLDHESHSIIPLDEWYAAFGGSRTTHGEDWPEYGDITNRATFPLIRFNTAITNDAVSRSIDIYLLKHPELVEQVKAQAGENTYEVYRTHSGGNWEILQLKPGDKEPILRLPLILTEMKMKNGDGTSTDVIIDVIQDKSEKGYGSFMHFDGFGKNLSPIRFVTGRPMPVSLTVLDVPPKDGGGIKDLPGYTINEYWLERPEDFKAAKDAAYKLLETGIIPPEFSKLILPSFA